MALTDQSGKVVERFGYGPYGELVAGEGTETPFLFNGQFGVILDGNGLYYMRARFYSPEIKRFVNQDVLIGNILKGQSLNRFAFVSGRPVSFVDPFGLAQEEVDRAADIVKTFLPYIYNELAMPQLGRIHYNWFIRLIQFMGLDWATSGYTDEFGYITLNKDFYSAPLLKRSLNQRRHFQIEQNIEELLATVIHEYIHYSEFYKLSTQNSSLFWLWNLWISLPSWTSSIYL